ncbi:MAG: pirin family protein [Ignavibacteriaceae bacterium]
MKTILHKSAERGVTEFGWLHSRHSFSFGRYFNPEKMGFGLLRVLNDDIVEPGEGFGKHPHDNMEIISIVLDGELEHKDSMGTGSVIKAGDIQVMSAGSGITHSEFNHSNENKVNFLQLWIIPKERNIKPGYDQKYFSPDERKNNIKTVVSGIKPDDILSIHQNAAVSIGNFEKGNEAHYKIKYPGNGAYLFILNGNIKLNGETIARKDAAGILDADEFSFRSESDTDFIIIDVPMK